MSKRFLYVLYKRLRPGLGLPVGFILMYGMFAGNFSAQLLLAAVGFLFIEVYGGLYNDYWDYDDDMRNGRKDKFTTCGYLTRVQSRNISFLLAFLGLVSLAPTNIFVFSLGLYYVILFIFYSNPIKRLKGSVKGYATLSSTFLLLPFALGTLSGGTAPFLPVFSSFYFFQFMYILCQKDSTDTKDRTNMFIVHGWGRSVKITALFSSLASVFLFSISIANPAFIVFWLVNLYAKFSNVNSIRLKAITKRKRYRLMLIEFLTPYLYLGGGML